MRFFTVIVSALLLPAVVWCADWPQWLGPDRNGISVETGLLKTWPKEGPTLKWKATNLGGDGYSSVAVVKGRVYTLAAIDDAEHVMALDENTGKTIWSTKIGKFGPNTEKASYPGPRSTPNIVGDKLYALGSDGDIACLETQAGKLVWSKSLPNDFGGKPGNWAYTESPLVDGDVVVISPGGAAATVVGLNKNTGNPVWKSAVPGGDLAGYGSPIRIEVGGVKQYVCFLSNGLVGLAAGDGKFLWRYEAVASPGEYVANIPTPVSHKDMVFGSSSMATGGGGVVKLTVDKGNVTATELWVNDKLKSQIGGFLRIGDHLYGTANAGKGVSLMCAEFATGKIVWEDPSVGAASMCVADGLLYVRGQNGTVALVDPSPKGYKELARFDQPDRAKKPAWPYPVVANGCLYLRDCGVLLCYDVREVKK